MYLFRISLYFMFTLVLCSHSLCNNVVFNEETNIRTQTDFLLTLNMTITAKIHTELPIYEDSTI